MSLSQQHDSCVRAVRRTGGLVPERNPDRIRGVWAAHMIGTDCNCNILRNIHVLNLFIDGGKITETAGNFRRSPSVGTWSHLGGQRYTSTFHFFRYATDGSVSSNPAPFAEHFKTPVTFNFGGVLGDTPVTGKW